MMRAGSAPVPQHRHLRQPVHERSYVYTKDSAQNVSSSAAIATITYSTTAPAVTLTSLTGGQLVAGGASASISWTASSALGFPASPIRLEYSANSGSTWTPIIAATSNSGSYSWSVPSADSSTYRVRVAATDLAGNNATSSSSSDFTVDSTTPAIALTSLTGGQVVTGGAATNITWTASDTNFGANPIQIEYSGDSGSSWTTIAASTANSGTYSWSVPSVDNATFRVRITATDLAGNLIASASSADFTIDSTPPTATLSGAPSNPSTATSLNVTVAGSSLTHYKYKVGIAANCGSATGYSAEIDGSTHITDTLGADGAYTLCVVGRDSVGNFPAYSSATSHSWTKDTVAPNAATALSWVETSPSASTTLTASWTRSSSSDLSNQKIQFYSDGTCATPTGTLTDLASSSTQSASFSDSAGGTFSYKLTSLDAVGNQTVSGCSSAMQILASIPLTVSPLYPNHGANWNDYVKNDGSDVYGATDTDCAGTETGSLACLHGGEKKKVVVTGVSSCSGLTLTDALDVFAWICIVKSGVATFFSSDFKSGKGLKNLLDPGNWKSNSVTLSGTAIGSSSSAVWWSNPVAPLPVNSGAGDAVINLDGAIDSGSAVDQIYAAGTIFILATSRTSQGYNLNLDKLALVTLPGVTLSYYGSASHNCNAWDDVGGGEVDGIRMRSASYPRDRKNSFGSRAPLTEAPEQPRLIWFCRFSLRAIRDSTVFPSRHIGWAWTSSIFPSEIRSPISLPKA